MKIGQIDKNLIETSEETIRSCNKSISFFEKELNNPNSNFTKEQCLKMIEIAQEQIKMAEDFIKMITDKGIGL